MIGYNRAFPLIKVCEALGYEVHYENNIFTISKSEETLRLDQSGNLDLIIINDTVYAAEPLLQNLLDITFRFLKNSGILWILK